MTLGTILIIILILILLGAIPAWPYSSGWGYGPSGIVGVILIVILILRQVFGLAPNQAERVTLRAHVTGLAYVMTLPIEEAKHRVGRAHGIARQAGFPLAFTIEIEQSR